MHSIYNRCLWQGVKFGSQKMSACIKRGRVIEADMIKAGAMIPVRLDAIFRINPAVVWINLQATARAVGRASHC